MSPKDRDTRATTSPPIGSDAEKAVKSSPTLRDPEPHHPDAFDEDDLSPSEVRERERPPELRRATAADVERVEKAVTEYIETDAREHKEIRDDLQSGLKELNTKLDTALATRDAKQDLLAQQMSEVRVQSAVTAAHATRLVAVVESDAAAKLRLETAQKEAQIADTAQVKQFKRDLTIKILGWMTPLAALAIGAIVALIEKCR